MRERENKKNSGQEICALSAPGCFLSPLSASTCITLDFRGSRYVVCHAINSWLTSRANGKVYVVTSHNTDKDILYRA